MRLACGGVRGGMKWEVAGTIIRHCLYSLEWPSISFTFCNGEEGCGDPFMEPFIAESTDFVEC